MATYIQGLQGYVPQVQPFAPDFNFLGNVLQTKQSRYDAAHKRLGQLYGTILNSPMSRDQNLKKRDEFFKQIDGQIKQLSGLDLSLQQNQDYAEQIFNPIVEDKHIIKDMTWTKQWQSEMNRAEGLRNCIDPDKCGGQFWDGGVKALQYKRMEFMKANEDDALTFDNAKFTPYQNVASKAMKYITDNKLKVKYDYVHNGYIVTDTNGQKMIAPLESYLTQAFATDPSIQAYFKTQAYVNRMDYVSQNAAQYGGDENKANMAYINNLYSKAAQVAQQNKDIANKQYESVKNIKDAYKQSIKDDKVLPSEVYVLNDWEHLNKAEQAAATTAQVYENNFKYAENAGFNMGNIKAMSHLIDSMMGGEMLKNQLKTIATNYANLSSEREMKADPYSLASHNSALALKNATALNNQEYDIWVKKELFKEKQEKTKAEALLGLWNGGGGLTDGKTAPNGTPLLKAPGAFADLTEAEKSYALTQNQNMTQTLLDKTNTDSKKFLKDLATTMIAQARKDMSNTSLVSTAEVIFNGAGINAKKMLHGTDGERAIELAKLNGLGYVKSTELFTEANDYLDPSKTGVFNKINSKWTKSFWQVSADARNKVINGQKDYETFSNKIREESLKSSNKLVSQYSDNAKKLEKELQEELLADARKIVIGKGGTREERLARMRYDKDATNFLSDVPLEDEIRAEKYKASLLDFMIKNSPGGIPTKENKDKLIMAWAAKNKELFKQPMLSKKTAEGDFYGHSLYKSPQEFARAYADDVIADWTADYSKDAKAWNALDGTRSNSVSGTAMQYNFNTAAGTHANNMQLVSVLKNFAALPDGQAKFGDASELGNDEDAKMAVSSLIDELQNPWNWNSKNKNPIRGSYVVQNVAAYNADMTSATIKLTREYVEENLLKGVQAKEKEAAIARYTQPITIFIPKSDADNAFYNNSQMTLNDYKLKEHIPITVSNSGGGDVTIVNEGGAYYITGTLKARDPKTGVLQNIEIESSKTYGTGLSADMLVNSWTEKLHELELRNLNALTAARQKYGVADIDAAIEQILEEQGARKKVK